MIFRFVAIAAVLVAGVLVLYLPSAYPPERFLDQLRIEHDLNTRFWGPKYSAEIAWRMQELLGPTGQEQGDLPVVASPQGATQVDAAVTAQMADVLGRLVRNQYVKSFEALLALATYRFSAFVQWLPVMLVFVGAAWFDGVIRRIVKSREFLQHKPELFALYGCA